MTSKAGSWIIAVGAVVAFAGLCFLPAALGDRADSSLLAVGASLFSLGILVVAGGVYLKAQAPHRTAIAGPAAKETESKNRRLRGACDLCRNEAPVIHCKVHQLHLCALCLGEHYDFRSCVYVPSTRRADGRPGRSMAARG